MIPNLFLYCKVKTLIVCFEKVSKNVSKKIIKIYKKTLQVVQSAQLFTTLKVNT